MILNKIHELCFEKNDVYQIESCADKIVINEDYHGIRILDLSLNTIKVISFIERLVFFSIYKKYDNSAVVLYALEQNSLIFVNLQTFKYFTIKPHVPLINYPFDRNYYWENDTLIFAIENSDIFYQVDFESSSVKRISHKAVKLASQAFFDFWKACKKYNDITIYPNQGTFTFKKNRQLSGFYDYKNKKLMLTKHSLGLFEEIYYHNGMFIFFDLWDKNIKCKNNKTFLPEPDPHYYYLRINGLNNGNIAVLLTNKDNHQKCILKVYEIHKYSL